MLLTNTQMYDKLKSFFGIKEYDLLALYPYGSQIYGTASEKSDYDFIAVFKDGTTKDEFSLEKENCNVHTYNKSTFQGLIDKHKIASLECLSLSEEKLLWDKVKFNFKLDLSKLRSSISEKASHSYVKAKKKMEVERDKNIYIAKKSLFHSFRIIDFGKQIALNGKVVNFSSKNDLWNEIFSNKSEKWSDYSELYRVKHNNALTEFRELVPK